MGLNGTLLVTLTSALIGALTTSFDFPNSAKYALSAIVFILSAIPLIINLILFLKSEKSRVIAIKKEFYKLIYSDYYESKNIIWTLEGRGLTCNQSFLEPSVMVNKKVGMFYNDFLFRNGDVNVDFGNYTYLIDDDSPHSISSKEIPCLYIPKNEGNRFNNTRYNPDSSLFSYGSVDDLGWDHAKEVIFNFVVNDLNVSVVIYRTGNGDSITASNLVIVDLSHPSAGISNPRNIVGSIPLSKINLFLKCLDWFSRNPECGFVKPVSKRRGVLVFHSVQVMEILEKLKTMETFYAIEIRERFIIEGEKSEFLWFLEEDISFSWIINCLKSKFGDKMSYVILEHNRAFWGCYNKKSLGYIIEKDTGRSYRDFGSNYKSKRYLADVNLLREKAGICRMSWMDMKVKPTKLGIKMAGALSEGDCPKIVKYLFPSDNEINENIKNLKVDIERLNKSRVKGEVNNEAVVMKGIALELKRWEKTKKRLIEKREAHKNVGNVVSMVNMRFRSKPPNKDLDIIRKKIEKTTSYLDMLKKPIRPIVDNCFMEKIKERVDKDLENSKNKVFECLNKKLEKRITAATDNDKCLTLIKEIVPGQIIDKYELDCVQDEEKIVPKEDWRVVKGEFEEGIKRKEKRKKKTLMFKSKDNKDDEGCEAAYRERIRNLINYKGALTDNVIDFYIENKFNLLIEVSREEEMDDLCEEASTCYPNKGDGDQMSPLENWGIHIINKNYSYYKNFIDDKVISEFKSCLSERYKNSKAIVRLIKLLDSSKDESKVKHKGKRVKKKTEKKKEKKNKKGLKNEEGPSDGVEVYKSKTQIDLDRFIEYINRSISKMKNGEDIEAPNLPYISGKRKYLKEEKHNFIKKIEKRQGGLAEKIVIKVNEFKDFVNEPLEEIKGKSSVIITRVSFRKIKRRGENGEDKTYSLKRAISERDKNQLKGLRKLKGKMISGKVSCINKNYRIIFELKRMIDSIGYVDDIIRPEERSKFLHIVNKRKFEWRQEEDHSRKR